MAQWAAIVTTVWLACSVGAAQQNSPGVTPPSEASAAGGADISIDQTLCPSVRQIRIERITTTTEGVKGVSWSIVRHFDLVRQAAVSASCAEVFTDLPPADYQATFEGASGVVGVLRFKVTSNNVADVRLESSTRAAGTVLLNGMPMRDVGVEFSAATRADNDSLPIRSVVAMTDAAGRYETPPMQAGDYQVAFREGDAAILGPIRIASIQSGMPPLDWSLEGASLTIMPTGWDGARPISVVISCHPMVKGFVVRTGQRLSIDQLPLVIRGLPFGAYDVGLHQGGEDDDKSLVSAVVPVTLTAAGGDVSITIPVVAPSREP